VFNSRTGTAFRWLHTPRRKVLLALRLLVKGLSLRGAAEVLGVKRDTIRRWLGHAAAHSEAVSQVLLKDLHLSQVQVDELWTFVKKNTKIPLGG
jgi:transposase-like protein